ncbi:hypothetical protein IE53DRAFT_316325, partial [Violaceomyces palustris]
MTHLPKLKLILPSIVASLALTPFVLVRPVANWMGPFSFLIFPFHYLFFFPSPSTVGAHLETVLLAVLGSAFGLGISFLAVAGAVWIDGEGSPIYNSPGSSALGACTLIFLCFFCGLTSSAIPRLKSAARICLFNSTWVIASGSKTIRYEIFSELFYPTIVAASVSLLANLFVFPRSSKKAFAALLIKALDTTCSLLEQAVEDFFSPVKVPPASAALSTASSRHVHLRDQLLDLNAELGRAFDAASVEISYTRVPVNKFKPMIPIIRNIRGWVACGMGLVSDGDETSDECNVGAQRSTRTSYEASASEVEVSLFEAPIRQLCIEIVESLKIVRLCLELCTGTIKLHSFTADEAIQLRQSKDIGHNHKQTRPERVEASSPDRAVLRQRKRLNAAVQSFKEALQEALRGVRPNQSVSECVSGTYINQLNGEAVPSKIAEAGNLGKAEDQHDEGEEAIDFTQMFKGEFYAMSFLMISLLEISSFASLSLKVVQEILRFWHAHPKRRIWWPVVKWKAWLRRAGSTTLGDLLGHLHGDLHGPHEDEHDPESGEAPAKDPSLFEDDGDSVLFAQYASPRKSSKDIGKAGLDSSGIHRFIQRLSRSPKALNARIRLSRLLVHLKRSRHLKFAFKLAAGVALLSLPAWLGSSHARSWWTAQRGQWLIITYIWCLETSTGASLRVSIFRLAGTISGGVWGLCMWEISRGNPYAMAFLLILTDLPGAYFILNTNAEGVGIVFGITATIIALIPQLHLEYDTVPLLAWNRSYMIFLGIVAALIVNLVAWPFHARVDLVRQISRATSQLQQLYLSLSRQMLMGGFVASAESTEAFERLEEGIQKRLVHARSLLVLMDAEISLVPKPTRVLDTILNKLQTIADLLGGLRRCREHGMKSIQQEAVLNVLEMRHAMVSSLLINLWCLGQALITRAPLPQFLPSPRLALEELTAAVAEQLSSAPEADGGLPDAFHALNSLMAKGDGKLLHHHRQSSGLHVLASGSPSRPLTREGTPSRTPGTPNGRRKKPLDYASFFLLAEHALLSDIVTSLESLMVLTRSLVGEASFIKTDFVPRGAAG